MTHRHFLGFRDLSKADIVDMLVSARAMKAARQGPAQGCTGRRCTAPWTDHRARLRAASTRTRVSFDVGMRQLGGASLTLNKSELQLGRGETIGDTARVLSRYVDMIMVRTDEEAKLRRWRVMPPYR